MYDLGLGCIVLGSILAQRATEAAIEAARRLDAEEATLLANLNKTKSGFNSDADSVRLLLDRQKTGMMSADHANLCTRIAAAESAVANARTHVALQEAAIEFGRIEKDIARACHRKEAEDARNGRSPSIATFRTRFDDLKRQIGGAIGDNPDGPLAPAGAAVALRSALSTAGGALQTANQALIAATMDRFEQAVQAYEDAVRQQQEALQRKQAAAEQIRSESEAIISGLKADPVVMRWHAASVAILEEELSKATSDQDVSQAREAAGNIVKEANSAQIRADQRDYIAKSISSTLEDMGFVVSAPQEEHPGHPATASIVNAATVSGKAIAISVPVEGQVWYNVEGYVKSVEAAVGGGQAAVCDEAEAVIEQMHEALAEEFHVRMGELKWDGKDPNRKLRAAKSLPENADAARNRE
jgi:hypothetical protein